PPEELAHRLTLAGLEVGAIDYVGVAPTPASELGSNLAVPPTSDQLVWDPKRIGVGHVLAAKPHPDADRLRRAMIAPGTGPPAPARRAWSSTGARGRWRSRWRWLSPARARSSWTRTPRSPAPA